MRDIVILADSTSDLSQELIEKYNVKIVPLHVSFPGDDKDYKDGVDIDSEKVYKKVEECGNTPKTGAINLVEFIDTFKKYIDDDKDILMVTIGYQLSSTYNNAVLASREYEEGRIEVINSMSLSTGEGLLVVKGAELIKEGKTLKETAEELRRLVPLVSAKFCIDRLDFLFKGGRCSGMTKVLATMLKIHPVAKMINGKLTVYKKPRGAYIKAVDEQINEFIHDFEENNIDTSCVFVTDSGHMDGEDKYIVEKLSKYVDPTNIHQTRAGCVVSSHCGPKTIGILYILKK